MKSQQPEYNRKPCQIVINLSNEIWKDVGGFEGYYKVSNLGRIKRTWKHKERIKIPSIDKNGYLMTLLCRDGERKNVFIHRIVAKAFIQNQQNFDTVNHKDENKLNNDLTNLEWMSVKDNVRYSNCIPLLQFDINGNFIKEWESLIDVERELGIDTSQTTKCCKCKKHYLTAGGYKWKYKNFNYE